MPRISNVTVHSISSPLLKINQEAMHLHATFNILSARPGDADRQLGVVKQKTALLKHKMKITSVYGEYMLEGMDIASRSCTIAKEGRIVATVSKKFFAMSDTYGVEIVGEEDHAFILALVIILDQLLFNQKMPILVLS